MAKTLFDKAERFIRSAQILAADGDFDSAAFGQIFARTNEIDPRFHQALLTAFSQRQLGDYRIETDLQQNDIDLLLSQANEFITVARDWLQQNPE